MGGSDLDEDAWRCERPVDDAVLPKLADGFRHERNPESRRQEANDRLQSFPVALPQFTPLSVEDRAGEPYLDRLGLREALGFIPPRKPSFRTIPIPSIAGVSRDEPIHSLYAFKHTTWEKALDTLMNSHGLSWEIRDGILHVGQASHFQNDQPRSMTSAPERFQPSRTVSITFRPSADGEPLLSVNVSKATRAEVLEALAKIERVAKAKLDKRSFNANWVLRPMKETSRDELETFSMEDITPNGLRALYP